MVKPSLIKFFLWLSLLFSLTLARPVSAASYSDFFISISDAKTALIADDQTTAKSLLADFQTRFASLTEQTSPAGQKVSQTLETLLGQDQLTTDDLATLSKALLAFEKEQNPVDEAAEKANFQTKVYPALENLAEVIATGDVAVMKTQYLKFNAVWTRNEAIVRASGSHYGKIETAMSFLRSSMEAEPFDQTTVDSNLEDLRTALDNFMAGKEVVSTAEVTSLAQGIALLEEAYTAFKTGQTSIGQAKMKTFISSWTVFEGEVSTRNAGLYTKVETQTPLIMAKGSEQKYQQVLKDLIGELSALTTAGSYTVFDAMLILLREGVEALLIVLSLVEILKAAKQRKGLKWIYGGAVLGLFASILAALALQMLFPALTSGANREKVEGFVGLFAVVMMLGIGAWLHSKSSVKAWSAFMDRQMKAVLSTGSFVSMFTLSFLAVFREGAETILFYVGILPQISLLDLLLGIGLALLALAGFAFLMIFFSGRLPVHLVFRVLTWLIYGLAFKMLGVSVHALQLTDVLPNHVLDWVPTWDLIGLYPSLEPILAQAVYLLILVGLSLHHFWQERRLG